MTGTLRRLFKECITGSMTEETASELSHKTRSTNQVFSYKTIQDKT